MEIVVKPSNIYNLQKYISKGATAFLFGMKDYSINQTSIVNIKSLTYIKKKISKKNKKEKGLYYTVSLEDLYNSYDDKTLSEEEMINEIKKEKYGKSE